MPMQKHPELTFKRIQQWIQRWMPLIEKDSTEIASVEVSGPHDRIPFAEAVKTRFKPAPKNLPLSPDWSTWWFRLSIDVPAAWRGKELELVFNTYSECEVWLDGEPLQGLNFEARSPIEDGGRIRCLLPADATRKPKLLLHVEAAANGLFGARSMNRYAFSSAEQSFRFERARLALPDAEAWSILHDLLVPLELIRLGEGPGKLDAWRGYLLEKLNHLCNVGDPDDRRTWPAVKKVLAEIYRHKNASYAHEITAVGHAHIDTAWLWPLAETRRKCVRTFSSALSMMERDPDFRFVVSQAVQYAWIKERHPGLYERIRKAIKRGQWIYVGGSWVEPDCVIPSGESLVRQFIHGQRFFRDEFGAPSRIFWNPDVFGYSGQLPQIMRGVGIDYFLTQKLSWNMFNKPQSQNFDWEGIDGTKVLTHFPPANTYNAMCHDSFVKDIVNTELLAKDNDRNNESMMLFGYGDGGGGVTRTMLETLKRAKDFQGLPRTRQRHPEEFFKRLEKRLKERTSVRGELYFELHRGCYTTQGRTKKGNRDGEIALRELEITAAIASVLNGRTEWPAEALDRMWKSLLLNQFHDILPGSSIRDVYVDAERDHAALLEEATKLKTEQRKGLVSGKGEGFLNPSGWERREAVPVTKGGKTEWRWARIPSLGTAPFRAEDGPEHPVSVKKAADGWILENGKVKAHLAKDGRLLSLFDKARHRETLAAGAKGELALYDDRPHAWEAWDVDVYHLETRKDWPDAVTSKIHDASPLAASVSFSHKAGDSVMTQIVRLKADDALLEFDTEVDWRHRRTFLKAEFPVAVNSLEATYEIQFGHVKRPTHMNDSFALARFETNGQRFCDLSESGFGVALVSDSKYGYSVHGNRMILSLLRGTESPDPEADLGKHRFRYGILPHGGDLAASGVVRRAYDFNHPVASLEGGVSEKSWFDADSRDLVIDTVKKADSGKGLTLRVYEAHGARGKARLRVPEGSKAAFKTNLLEEDRKPLPLENGEIRLSYKPFEILTIVIE